MQSRYTEGHRTRWKQFPLLKSNTDKAHYVLRTCWKNTEALSGKPAGREEGHRQAAAVVGCVCAERRFCSEAQRCSLKSLRWKRTLSLFESVLDKWLTCIIPTGRVWTCLNRVIIPSGLVFKLFYCFAYCVSSASALHVLISTYI